MAIYNPSQPSYPAYVELYNSSLVGLNQPQFDFTDLSRENGPFSQLLIIGTNITLDVPADINMRLSVDNGVSFLDTLGDYATVTSIGDFVETTFIQLGADFGTGFSFTFNIINNGANLYPTGDNSYGDSAYVIPGILDDGFLNAIRFIADGGNNFVGGMMRVYGV